MSTAGSHHAVSKMIGPLGWEPKRLSGNSAGMWKSMLSNGTPSPRRVVGLSCLYQPNYLKPCVFIAGYWGFLAVPPIPLPRGQISSWLSTPQVSSYAGYRAARLHYSPRFEIKDGRKPVSNFLILRGDAWLDPALNSLHWISWVVTIAEIVWLNKVFR